jgi:hypothetical protein
MLTAVAFSLVLLPLPTVLKKVHPVKPIENNVKEKNFIHC